MLSKRILTAVISLPILLPMLIYAGSLVNMLFFFVVALIALSEYYGMAFQEDGFTRRVCIALGGLLYLCWGLAIVYQAPAYAYHLPAVAIFLLMFLYFLFHTGDMDTVGARASKAGFGLLYVVLLTIFFVALHNLEGGWRYIILLLGVVWLNDSGAYFAGRSLGKHKFYEKISPKKTWEGSVGGAIASVVAAFFFNWILALDLSHVDLLALSIVGGYLGQYGDLCESMIKRSYKIKDSGSIIPGHGGILDRIDAVLFVAPFFYYYLTLVA